MTTHEGQDEDQLPPARDQCTGEAQVKELKDMPKVPVPGGLLCLWLDRPVQLWPPDVLGVLIRQCPTRLHPIIGRASGMESHIQILFKEIS